MLRPTRVRIHRQALQNNLKRLKAWTGPGFFCPMVKAFAYGHDDVLIAQEIAKSEVADAVGVALVEEGMRLRQKGFKMPILVFAPFDVDGARAMFEHDLTPVVGRIADLQALSEAGVPLKVHLKFNTGMQRLGFDREELENVRRFLRDLSFVGVVGVCTHLTHGEEAADPEGPSARQFEMFRQFASEFPTALPHAHKSSSLAVLRERVASSGLGARPGISLYGLPHHLNQVADGLLPVLSWQTELTHFHMVEKDKSVGYSSRWMAARRSVIGVVPVGYGDGYSRALSNKGQMLFRGRRVPVVGSVCMDYTMVDLTDAIQGGDPQPGEAVVLVGAQEREVISVGELAEKAGTIAYEVVTSISRRIPREAV
jgi:alanine racemase